MSLIIGIGSIICINQNHLDPTSLLWINPPMPSWSPRIASLTTGSLMSLLLDAPVSQNDWRRWAGAMMARGGLGCHAMPRGVPGHASPGESGFQLTAALHRVRRTIRTLIWSEKRCSLWPQLLQHRRQMWAKNDKCWRIASSSPQIKCHYHLLGDPMIDPWTLTCVSPDWQSTLS